MSTPNPEPIAITSAAFAFATSYGSAMHLGKSTSVTPASRELIQATASALGTHYLPGFISFLSGHQVVAEPFATQEGAVASITGHLERFEQHGLGFDVRLKSTKITPVSQGSALCHLTWEIFPRAGAGVEGWDWENVYGYRRVIDPEGKVVAEGWEFVISDNEIAGLFQRVPGFWS